jgi:hypothetical protein
MISISARICLLVFAVLFAGPGFGQDKKESAETGVHVSPQGKFILDMFAAHNNDTLCMLGDVPVATIERLVFGQLKASGLAEGATATPQQVQAAVWTLFPCPFSPHRAELIPASAKDVAGVWLFPHDSQPYRYGAKSLQQPATAEQAVSCEAVGFYPGGEYRTAEVPGANTPCPFHKAADMNPARKRPRVAKWAIESKGKLRVTRTDMPDYAEEWDIYLATKGFQALNLEIKAGDLVAYRRGEKGYDASASSEFRHLQRLK